jgi:hypothetical protein
MADGFLGRWAKRKEAVRKGEEVAAEPEVKVEPAPLPSPLPPPRKNASVFPGAPEASPASGRGSEEGEVAQPPAPLPTLVDVESLTSASDFSPYVRAGVAPEVRNAAMKKLFSDPHFNVMDRLDTYIDDYGKPDPIPMGMLRQLASAKFLNLFAKEEEEERLAAEAASGKAPTDREVADVPGNETVAQSSTAETIPPAVPPAEDHADPDLRLQQDDAPGPQGPGHRA